jgi:hypothetical protein
VKLTPQQRAVGLWLLLGLFVLRVVGQLVVGLSSPTWLPAWHEWYSGLLPYSLLLPAQLVLIAWMVVVNHQNTRVDGAGGRFLVQSARTKRLLRGSAAVYVGAMVVRYAVTMTLRPEMRWLHGTIPIVFHCVLAAYLALLAEETTPADGPSGG